MHVKLEMSAKAPKMKFPRTLSTTLSESIPPKVLSRLDSRPKTLRKPSCELTKRCISRPVCTRSRGERFQTNIRVFVKYTPSFSHFCGKFPLKGSTNQWVFGGCGTSLLHYADSIAEQLSRPFHFREIFLFSSRYQFKMDIP